MATTLDEWARRAGQALGLAPELATAEIQRVVLDLARQVAHGVARPAAPVTAFLLGVAVGRGADPAEAAARIAAALPPAPDAAAGSDAVAGSDAAAGSDA